MSFPHPLLPGSCIAPKEALKKVAKSESSEGVTFGTFSNVMIWNCFAVFQVIKAVNETFSFQEDLQEIEEAQQSFTKFFEEKLRCVVQSSLPCA